MTKPRILVVADDAPLRATLARWLMAAGYAVELAETAKRAREVVATADIALAIVAPDRLGTAGTELARELGGQIERLILIADEADAGSPGGPDGYIPRPLSEPDVLGRVKTALGVVPIGEEPGTPQLIRLEGYTLDAGARTCVDASGQKVTLTRAEFSLLLALGRQPGRVLSRDELSHAVTGRGAQPDDRSVDVLMSRLRRKIEPDPKTPRIIVTEPGQGYRLAAKPQTAVPMAPTTAAPSSAVVPIAQAKRAIAQETKPQDAKARETGVVASSAHPRRSIGPYAAAAIGAAVALASTAGMLIMFWHPGSATRDTVKPAETAPKFDATLIPFVYDSARAQLSGYEFEPNAKAIAISREGWGTSAGAADDEAAKNEALERCRERDKGGYCRIYAVGNNVMWSNSMLTLPLPADIRADGTGTPLTSDGLDKIWQAVWRVAPPQPIAAAVSGKDHKALAVSTTSVQWSTTRPTRAEAIRIAIERCSDRDRTPCLLLSVDGVLTVEIPQSRRITGPFTLAGEREMSEADRARIAQIYGGKDWRALARGQSGRWYAVDGQENEAAAVDAVLKTCRAAEKECVLHAIGNWRVGEKLESNHG